MTLVSNESSKKTTGQRFEITHPEGIFAGWQYPTKRLNLRHAEERQSAPHLLFIHATGFCASVYRQVFEAGVIPAHVWSLDMRGHGRTQLPHDPSSLRSWRVYRDDVLVALEAIGNLRRDAGEANPTWYLAGHSMGGVTAALAAANHIDHRGEVRGVTMVEPVALPHWLTLVAATPLWRLVKARFPLITGTRKRRHQWPGYNSVYTSYGQKTFFRSWADGVIADYLRDGLVVTSDGATLSCDPAWEAATFGAQANPFWAAIKKLTRQNVPVHVITGRLAGSTVQKSAERGLRKAGVTFVRNDAYGHLLPMEAPSVAASYLVDGVTGSHS